MKIKTFIHKYITCFWREVSRTDWRIWYECSWCGRIQERDNY